MANCKVCGFSMASYVKNELCPVCYKSLKRLNGYAVPVVRCKDCKHRRNDEDYVSGHYCVKRPSNGGYFCEDDDFCSYGERRENNG